MQQTNAGIDYQRHDLMQIAGMGGNSHPIRYTSARTVDPITVLVVPTLVGDQYAETYLYFAGMTAEQATTLDWIRMYDACQELTG